jgi:hypothetical protein
MGRFTIEELAHLDLLLLSDECYYFTGAAIAMDGGQQVAGRGMFAGLTRLSAEEWAAARERSQAASAAAKAQRTV